MEREEILKVITANITDIIEGASDSEITEDKSMKDYGADSLEIVEVVSRSMKQLKLKVPRVELSNIETIGGLVDLFKLHADKTEG